MKTKEYREGQCAVCGAEYHASHSAENDNVDCMIREWVEVEMQACPCCGYVNRTVSEVPPAGVDMVWLQSNAFYTCDGLSFQNDMAKQCYRYYLVRLADHDLRSAMSAVSHAAQICEEVGESENAEVCLKKAAELAQKQYQSDSDPMMLAMWCEYLRRSGQFETVLEVTEQEDLSDAPQFIRSVIEYQRKGARAHDKSVMMLRTPPRNEVL